MLEHYCGFLNFYNAKGDVMAESRGSKEDRLLKQAYRELYEYGTQSRAASFFNKTLTSKEIKLKPKIANIAGLQVCDLLAYPIKQEILFENKRTADSGDVFGKSICAAVRNKHNRQVPQGRIEGYSKVFLK